MKKSLGIKFFLFRKAIKKTREELANEIKTRSSKLEKIENGEIFPDINILHFLSHHYSLNINWLLNSEEEMFAREQPAEIDLAYVKKNLPRAELLLDEKYKELFQLMEIPGVEQFIFDQLGKLKAELEDK